MAVTNGWGKGTQNNSNGWGKFQNTIGAASIYEDSYSGETVLIGTSAAFSYSKSSFDQGEADPTPTITGTTGGTFNADAGLVFVDTGTHNSSTGQIDLSASTIDSHIITYTVGGVQSGQTIAVTASPFVDNTFSMNFDGVSSYIDTGFSLDNSYTALTLSGWVKYTSISNFTGTIFGGWTNNTLTGSTIIVYTVNNKIQVYYNNSGSVGSLTSTTTLSTGTWFNVALRFNGSTLKLYINGNEEASGPLSAISNLFGNLILGGFLNATQTGYQGFLNGKLDEIALWDTALDETAILEIYNATSNNTGKVLDLNTDSGNYTSSSNLQYWNRLGD